MNDLSTIFLIILYLFILAWSISLCTKWIEPFEFSFIRNKDWRIAIKGTITILAGISLSAIISIGIIFIVMALVGSKSKKDKI